MQAKHNMLGHLLYVISVEVSGGLKGLVMANYFCCLLGIVGNFDMMDVTTSHLKAIKYIFRLCCSLWGHWNV